MITKSVIHLRSASAMFVFLLTFAAALSAQNKVVILWPNGAPGSEHWAQKEAEYMFGPRKEVRNVSKPSITLFLPPAVQATGTGVIVAPGGAFTHLAWENEGTKVGEWLQAHGMAAFVLKYRLVDTGTDEEYAKAQAEILEAMRHPGQHTGPPPRGGIPSMDNPIVHMSVTDSLKAIETVRSRAAEWHVDPNRIGIIGFSAGGWAAAMTGLEHSEANRPDFIGAIYPCCFNPNNALNASTIKVPDDAPPLFLLNAANDGISAASPSLFMDWRAAKKPAAIHSFVAGGHGFGMAIHNRPTDNWIELFNNWLHYEKF
jgi:acetyl esterase/lipase